MATAFEGNPRQQKIRRAAIRREASAPSPTASQSPATERDCNYQPHFQSITRPAPGISPPVSPPCPPSYNQAFLALETYTNKASRKGAKTQSTEQKLPANHAKRRERFWDAR